MIGALTYPAVMIVMAILVVTILMSTVVPKITAIFANAKVQLPLLTRVLIAVSNVMSSYWWLLLILLGLGIWLLLKSIKDA